MQLLFLGFILVTSVISFEELPSTHVILDSVDNKNIMFKSDIDFKEHICLHNYMAILDAGKLPGHLFISFNIKIFIGDL